MVIGLLAAGALALRLRVRRYGAGFHMAVRRDDHLHFGSPHDGFPVVVAPDGLEIPTDLARNGQTVLLRLRVKATPLGRLRDPFIEIGDGPRRHRQYFERGASGHRYLNLSPLFGDQARPALTRVALHGRSIGWRAEASLLVFARPDIEGAGVVVLAPHPDDAEIAAFGLYAHHRSWVVTITGGEKGLSELSAIVPSGELASRSAWLRVSDSLTVPQLGQVPPERSVNLVCPDGDLANMCAEPARPFRLACEDTLPRAALRSRNHQPELQGGGPDCTWNDLIAELRQLLERAQPDVVVCPHPLLEAHLDHVFTAVALDQVLRALPDKPPRVFLYAVHARGVPTYPLGPSESLMSPPPWRDDLLIAESIYSHPLSPETRRAKYFAVEAMHGVRTYADGGPTTWRALLASVKRDVSAYLAGTGVPPTSLLRRAPRPNELFYVVSPTVLSELVERALRSPAIG